jgi:biopolymer transport protein ExbB
VLSIIEAAGWPDLAHHRHLQSSPRIIGERFWSLRTPVVRRRTCCRPTIPEYQGKGVSQDLVNRLQTGPLIGRIFARGSW